MNGTQITIVGNIVDEVVTKPTVNGFSKTSFRVVSTERRRDRDSGDWVDGNKLFVNVNCWRELAENVAISMKKGDPVVVAGRLHSRQYVKEESNRIAYELEVEHIGHDLNRGVSKFAKRRGSTFGTTVLDPDGFPERVDDGYELVGADAVSGAVALTG